MENILLLQGTQIDRTLQMDGTSNLIKEKFNKGTIKSNIGQNSSSKEIAECSNTIIQDRQTMCQSTQGGCVKPGTTIESYKMLEKKKQIKVIHRRKVTEKPAENAIQKSLEDRLWYVKVKKKDEKKDTHN